MVILFDMYNLPEDIFEIIFATKQQKIVGKLLINHMKEHGGEIGKTEMSMFATALHEGTVLETKEEGPFKPKKTVKLFKAGGVELASLYVTETIAPDQIVAHDLSWAIPSNEPTGPTTIYGQVILAGDENSNNDLTSDLNVMVYPEGLVIIIDEGFEGGSLPAGWSQEYVVGENDWAFQNGGAGTPGNPSSAHTGNYNAILNNSSSTADITKMISPEINLGTANEGILTFWHAQTLWASDQDELHVYYKNSSGGAWTLIESFIADTPTWTERIIFLPNPSTTYYVAFEGVAQYGYGVCLDDILITGDPTVYDNDLAGQVISGNTIVNAGNTEAYSIEVKNVGNNSQNNYTVKLFKEGGEEIALLDINQAIAPGATISHDLIWDIPVNEPSGTIHLYGQVELAGDENPNNDSTNNLEIQIFPQGVMEITVGNGTDNDNRTPVCFQYKNSLTEMLYFADELTGAQGMITEITYYNNFTNNLINKPTTLWLGETTQTNLTNGWIPSTSLTEVFNGTVSYPSGTNSVTIQLSTPYFYNGGNLVVMAFRPMDTQNYGSTDYFMHDTTLDHEDRTRYERDDTIVLDPANPPEVSYSGEFFANTTHNEDLNMPPEVRNVIPGNFSDASDILAGKVEISLEARDDLGIEGVQIEISTITGVDPSNYPTDPNTIEYSDLQVVSSYPHNMDEGDTNAGWTTYSDIFDSTQGTDGLYLVDITIGDIDPFSHTISVKFLIIIHNDKGNPFEISGFNLEYFVGCIGFTAAVGFIVIKKKIRYQI